jgi:hypothetical protein
MSQSIYIPQHFRPEELVPPDLFKVEGADSVRRFDPKILQAADLLREKYGPCIINNWNDGGDLEQRGFRTDPKVGAPKSAHRVGMALDLTFFHVAAAKIRGDIRDGLVPEIRGLVTRIENGTSWLHIDCKACEPEALTEFNKSGIHFFEV